MVFNIYNVASSGSALHTETQTVVVNNGIFNVLLGSAATLTVPFDVQYYLGVTPGADPEMSPRQPLAASPYAIRAATASPLDASMATSTAVGGDSRVTCQASCSPARVAMSTTRAYHPAKSHSEIMGVLREEESGKHDPKLMDLFREIIENSGFKVAEF